MISWKYFYFHILIFKNSEKEKYLYKNNIEKQFSVIFVINVITSFKQCRVSRIFNLFIATSTKGMTFIPFFFHTLFLVNMLFCQALSVLTPAHKQMLHLSLPNGTEI